MPGVIISVDSRTRLGPVTIALHWIVGVPMITLISVGIYMAEAEVESLCYWHKSFAS